MELNDNSYKAPEFLKKIRALLKRDASFLRGSFQRTVILKRKGQPRQHAITRIDVLDNEGTRYSQVDRDYGAIRFIAELITIEKMVSRLVGLRKLQFNANRLAFKFPNNPGFSNRYYPSNNEFGAWPGTLFDVGIESVYLSGDTLIHADPELPTFQSEYAAVGEFLDIPNFSSSDSRIGRIILFFPNFNGRIQKLSLSSEALTIELKTVVPLSDLTLDVEYSNGAGTRKHRLTPQYERETVAVEFSPTTLHIWLKSRFGYVLDYHREDQYGSVGANAVLPKVKSPTGIANIPIAVVGTGFSPYDSVDIFAPREEDVTTQDSNLQHTFLPAGSQHDAYVEIRRIIQQATTEILIVDSWVDHSLWTLLRNVPPICGIRVLTQHMKNDFQLEAKKFAAQHKNAISIRQTKNYHDRFIIVNGKRCFHLGASIKDAGNKACALSEISSTAIAASVVTDVESEWIKGIVVNI
ncbi:MAG TPA: hypothetical protein VKZ53_31710 [Candidatus Angelobacter sp.]|nr:hypothetical protein [Candidatus Angelobacter sp.]